MAVVHYHPSKAPDHFHACVIEVTPFEAGGLTATLPRTGGELDAAPLTSPGSGTKPTPRGIHVATEKKLYEYAIILQPKLDKDGDVVEEARLVVEPTYVLATSQEQATMLAARAIPDDLVDVLYRVEVAPPPFLREQQPGPVWPRPLGRGSTRRVLLPITGRRSTRLAHGPPASGAVCLYSEPLVTAQLPEPRRGDVCPR